MIAIYKIIVVLFVFIFVLIVSSQILKMLSSFFIKQKQKNLTDKDLKQKDKTDNKTNLKNLKLIVPITTFVIVGIVSGKIILALLFAIIVFMGINAYITKQSKKQINMFEDQLVEALQMITNSVNAGQSLIQGIENMVKDTKPPLSSEFEEALRQVKLGKPLQEALSDIAKRISSKDLTMAVTSINLSKETGGNLGEILLRLCDTIRERKKIKGKIVSLTAQGRASGIVMSIIPVALLVVLYVIEPDMMGLLFNTLLGNIMLLIAGVMISVGMFFINKIVNIDI